MKRQVFLFYLSRIIQTQPTPLIAFLVKRSPLLPNNNRPSSLQYFGSFIYAQNLPTIYNQQSRIQMQDKTNQVLNGGAGEGGKGGGGGAREEGGEDQRRGMADIINSTRLEHPCKQAVSTKLPYQVHSRILTHTPITENMRAKLRTFLMAETSKQCLLRETCTLACALVDLYFLHLGQVVVSEFQNLVLGCLILAAKIKEGKFPTISYNIFSREQLLNYERRVAKRLNYFLNPHTYHAYAERTVVSWDCFTAREGRYNLRVGECSKGVNFKLRRIYEQLDCAYMVLKSLDYDCEALVANLFYLNARMINVYDIPNAPLLDEESFTLAFYPEQDAFLAFFTSFLQFHSQRELALDPRMGSYLKLFLGVSTAQKEWTIRGNAEVLQQMRIWDKIQTYPKDNYTLAKGVMEKVKRGQFDRK